VTCTPCAKSNHRFNSPPHIDTFIEVARYRVVSCISIKINTVLFEIVHFGVHCFQFSIFWNVSAGLILSACLPVFADGKFQGVTCTDLKVDKFFSEIIDYRLEQLSYAFFVDARGRMLIHPLLPRSQNYPENPIFLDMESVELSSEIGAIKQAMLR